LNTINKEKDLIEVVLNDLRNAGTYSMGVLLVDHFYRRGEEWMNCLENLKEAGLVKYRIKHFQTRKVILLDKSQSLCDRFFINNIKTKFKHEYELVRAVLWSCFIFETKFFREIPVGKKLFKYKNTTYYLDDGKRKSLPSSCEGVITVGKLKARSESAGFKVFVPELLKKR
jgi:hypothetical protein